MNYGSEKGANWGDAVSSPSTAEDSGKRRETRIVGSCAQPPASDTLSWVHLETPDLARIDPTRLFAFQAIYSFMDAALLHPFTVAQTVAENNVKTLTEAQRHCNFRRRVAQSVKNNLSVWEAIRKISAPAHLCCDTPFLPSASRGGDRGRGPTATLSPSNCASAATSLTEPLELLPLQRQLPSVRACFTGFPILLTHLFLYDALQFFPQTYFTQQLGLSATASGSINAFTITLLCTPLSVIFRQQISLRCSALPHHVPDTVRAINDSSLPNSVSRSCPPFRRPHPSAVDASSAPAGGVHGFSAGGTDTRFWKRLRWAADHWQQRPTSTCSRIERVLPRYYRGLVGNLLAVPQAGISWGTYEKCKSSLQCYSQSTHVWTSLLAGALSGAVGSVLTRPLAAVVARKQLESENTSYREIVFDKMWKQEGPGAFYKGLGARLVQSVPRMAIFFSAYSLCITWSMR